MTDLKDLVPHAGFLEGGWTCGGDDGDDIDDDDDDDNSNDDDEDDDDDDEIPETATK